MQTRSARAKPWLAKSPGATTPSLSRRAGSASDRTQLAADILNEDRVALAARLRDPGDDPPPNYFRETTAVDDEPCACPLFTPHFTKLTCRPVSTFPASLASKRPQRKITMSGTWSVSASRKSGGKYALSKRWDATWRQHRSHL
jgi:hypothetical protein